MSEERQVNIKAKDEVLAGNYSNAAQVSHTKEEFVIDFMSLFPPQGTLNARIIMSPGHMKRLFAAMQENIQRYEAVYGAVKASDGPKTEFGFPIE